MEIKKGKGIARADYMWRWKKIWGIWVKKQENVRLMLIQELTK